MNKRWVAIVVIAALIIGTVAGIFLSRGGEEGKSSVAEQTPTPATQQQTPTPQTPTPTPTQDGKKIILQQYADVYPKDVIGAQELISKALAGEYQEGAIIRGFSGIYRGFAMDPKSGSTYDYCFYFEPQYEGYYVGATNTDPVPFSWMWVGDTVVFEGKYAGLKKSWKGTGEDYEVNIVLLSTTRLFLIKR